jgi:molecular chaperone GrpE
MPGGEMSDETETETVALDDETVENVETVDPETEADVVTLIDPNPELTQAKADLSEVQARLRAVSAAYRQLQEDAEATKERLNRASAFQTQLQRGETVAKMFDPLDNLNRCVDSMGDGDAKEGLKMVIQQFMGALSELGLEVLSPEGQMFDPNFHEALTVVPVDNAEQDGSIIEVFSAGYRVGSRLLKPARVVIGKHEAADS